MTESARKRPRVDSPEDSGNQPGCSTPILTSESSQFWLSDGNVIIQAESTQFRVHKSVLSMHSTVFCDMFMIPQPHGQLEVEGCPIVHLSDTAGDVDCLLRAFYGRSVSVSTSLFVNRMIFFDITSYDSKKPQEFAFLAALLRLGKKYDCVMLFADALDRLQTSFSSNLSIFDSRRSSRTIIFYIGLYFDIMNLAQELGIQSILPALLYLALQTYELVSR